MNVFKKSMLGLCVPLLVIVLYVFGVALGLYQVFSTPDAIKGALRDSGIYQSVVGDVLKQAQKGQPAEGQEGGIPLDNPQVQSLIQSAASPELLQTQAEGALDSAYAWLRGETLNLAFTVELGDAKTKLADELGKFLEQNLAGLPACAPGSASGQNLDPFNATCLPEGVSAAQAAAQAKNELLNGEFLKETTFTADDVKTDGDRTLEQQLQAIPQTYQAIKWALFGTGVLALLLAVAVVFLSINWRSGLKKLSIVFIVVGSIHVLFSWLAGMGFGRLAEFAKEPLQQSAVKVGQALAGDLRGWWMWYGIALLVVGAVTLVVLRLTKPKTVWQEADKQGELAPTNEDPAAMPPYLADKPKAAVAVEHKQKPKPVKRLIQ